MSKEKFIDTIISLLIFFVLITAGELLSSCFLKAVSGMRDARPDLYEVLRYTGQAFMLLPFIVYVFVFKGERKHFRRMRVRTEGNTIKFLFLGLAAGTAMNLACIGSAALHGDLTFTAGNPGYALLLAVFALAVQTVSEDLIFMIFLPGRLEENIGGVPAAIAGSLVFSLMHAGNLGFTLPAMLNLFLLALFCMLFIWLIGSAWFVCGFHFAWNCTQTCLFGLPNSGCPSSVSILALQNSGYSLLYSREFGVEAGIVCTIVLAAACAVTILMKHRI